MTKRQYLREIADRTCLPHRYRKKILQDLSQEFDALLAQGRSPQEVMKRMGQPDDLAAGIYENYISTEEVTRPFVEYRSSATLFGMPLVHIVKAKRRALIRSNYNQRNTLSGVPTARGILAIGRRARGVVAIGNLSCGVIAIGNLSAGVLCLSNVGAGLFSFGNLVLGLAGVLGNVVLGLLAAGNLAIGYGAVGNLGMGRYAIGHLAVGPHSLSLDPIQMGPEVRQFLDGVPPLARSFLSAGVEFVQSLEQGWFWLSILLGILGVAIVVTWIAVSHRLESAARHPDR